MDGIIEQYSRISFHTVTGTSGLTGSTSFTVPSTENFTDSTWTKYDLALSEIGIDEDRGRADIRIGNTIKNIELNRTSANNANAFGSGSTATGAASFAEGFGTTAYGDYSHSEGYYTIASGTSSHAGGYIAVAYHDGEWARSGYDGNFGQYGIVDYVAITRNATLTEMFIGPSSLDVFDIPTGSGFRYKLTLLAINTASGDMKEWIAEGLIKNVSGTTSLVGSSNTSTWADASLATAALTVTADNTGDKLKVEVTGVAATDINWYGKLEYTKILY